MNYSEKTKKTKIKEVAQELKLLTEAETNLQAFVEYTMPDYIDGWHRRVLTDALQKVAEGKIKRLMVFMPPRHGKSEIASVRFPAWYLGNFPQNQFIACSYSEELATTFSDSIRSVIQSERYKRIWDRKLVKDTSRKWQFSDKENNRSNYIATGVRGGITGEGAEIILIDDPIKNMEEANSRKIRDKTWEWYRTTLYTRLHPGGAIILIMTRWHHDDLAGRLLKEMEINPRADKWEVIHLKAIEDGKALWPEQFPLELLESIKENIGSRSFSAQYQGMPSTQEGNIINREWWKWAPKDNLPEGITIQTWDTAYKTGEENDFTAGFMITKTKTGFYVHPERFYGRWEYPEMRKLAESFYEQFKPSIVLIEDKASGQSVIQDLKKNTGMPIKAVKVDKDKKTRVESIAPLIEGGRVFLPTETPWTMDLIEEFAAFPTGEHDDQVDAITQALIYFNQSSDRDVVAPVGTTEGLFSRGITAKRKEWPW